MKTKFFIIGFLSALVMVSLSGAVFATKEYSKKFSDVKDDQWYYSAVMDLSEEGLLNGYADGTFGVGKNITREEAAKLFYLTNLRIAKLEAKLAEDSSLEEDDSEDSSPETDENESVADDSSDEDDSTVDDSDEEDQIVLNVVTDLTSVASIPAGYSVFEENIKKYKVSYPSIYFWDNSIGESMKAEGYLWRTEFSLDDFASEEDAEIDFVVSLVDPDLVESDSEVLIFVKRDANTSFLVEGKLAKMKDLQKIAASFKNIQ